MKKNIMMRLASILLIAVLMSTCAISGTFAKYATVTSGKASAKVAKWSFKVGDTQDITQTADFTFDLGETITDTGENGTVDVATGSNGNLLLAPGTQGSFDIVLQNTSEVTARYKVEFAKTGMPGNFTYTYEVNDVEKEENDLTEFTQNSIINMNDTVTITVNWTWPFDGDPSSDNQHQATDLELGVTVTVEQVD